MTKLVKPGTDNEPKGKYKEVGPRGGEVPKPRVVSIDPGDRLPPTQEKGRKWKKILIYHPLALYCFGIFIFLLEKHHTSEKILT